MKTRRSFSIVALLFASACSGATSTELFDPVAQESIPAAPIVGRDDGTSSGGSASSSGGTSTGGSSSTSTSSSSSGGSGAPPPGPAQDAGTPPPPVGGCVAEAEPNDGPAQTQWFTSCFSGSVKREDIDYASISAPITAKRVEIKHQETGGDVQYRIYINGVAYDSFEDDAPDFIPVFGGATYSFEMTAAGGGGANRTYELTVTFE
jgi:hypothetical protein